MSEHARKSKKATPTRTGAKAPARANGDAARRMDPPPAGVKVRMYRTGLGDCFLLCFPHRGPRKAFYVLIDCGVYFKSPPPRDKAWIRQIVADIAAATGGWLDLLVITHEHWDHVSAFHRSQAQDLFENDIKLGAVWMAWTENLNLKLARDLHNGRRAARAALAKALRQMGAAGRNETGMLVSNILDFFGGPVEGADDGDGSGGGTGALAAAAMGAAKKSVQTEEAMGWVRDTYGKGKVRFLHPGEGPLALDDGGGVPGARVYVLGPPEDDTLIRRHEPRGDEVFPKGAMAAAVEASFFAAFGVVPARAGEVPDNGDVAEARRMSLPFDERYQIGIDAVRAAVATGSPPAGCANASPESVEFFRKRYLETAEEWRKIEGDWLEAAGEFALQLDNATNNTSLAFALEIGPPGRGKVLLFPGDAQVGNWLSWFGKVPAGKRVLGKDMLWTLDDSDGGTGRTVTAEDLLRRTVLYKVGHHGSHNATLRAKGLELMGRADGSGEFVALLPVDEHVARELAHYGEMPLRSLVKELALRTNGRVARNDEDDPPKNKTSTLAPIPGAPRLDSGFVDEKTNLYFDYTVKPPR